MSNSRNHVHVTLRRSTRRARIVAARVIAVLLAQLVCTPAASAQWTSLPSTPTSEVIDEGFHVTVVGDSEVHVFSAMTRAWRNLGAYVDISNTERVMTGDWTVLIKRPGLNAFTAYSARLDQCADIVVPLAPSHVRVEDDVIFLYGGGVASAYSAQTNGWDSVPVTSKYALVSSRFVVGVIGSQQQAGVFTHGFSARYGQWVSYPGGANDTLAADGNVLLAKPGGPPGAVHAFSGVLGTWSVSPAQHAQSAPVLDHNVAYIRAESTLYAGGATCGYSAYSGVWQLDGPARPDTLLTANVVLVKTINSDPRVYRAFGARPAVWATLVVPGGVELPVEFADEDWVVVADKNAHVLHAFSGLCGGDWFSEAYGGSVTVLSSAGRGADSLALGRDTTGVIHTFSPQHAAWAPPPPVSGTLLLVGACYSVVETADARYAYSSRHNVWVAGPPKDPGAVHVWGASSSAFIGLDTNSRDVVAWHERYGAWLHASLPGAGSPSFAGNRNVVVVDASSLVPAGPVLGFSAQRGDFVAAPAGVGAPIASPVAEENVAWFRTADNAIHAFGSPADSHTWFQWPLGTEYQVTRSAAPPAPVKLMLRGAAGAPAFVIIALAPLYPGKPVPGFCGSLLLDPSSLILLPLATIGGNGMLPAPVEIPLPGFPVCAGLWTQGIVLSAACPTLLGPVAEPVRVF
ncbi:MAG: hypothetical protein R3F56_21940 [Planctomycetota bacterium]